jgi:hypothetical protein
MKSLADLLGETLTPTSTEMFNVVQHFGGTYSCNYRPAAVFITERLLQKLAFGRLSAEPAVTFDADPNHRLTETSMAEIILWRPLCACRAWFTTIVKQKA